MSAEIPLGRLSSRRLASDLVLGTFLGVDLSETLSRLRARDAPCVLARQRLLALERELEDEFASSSHPDLRTADVARERMLWYVSAGMWNRRIFRVVLSAEHVEYVDLQLDNAGYPLRGLYHIEILREPVEYSLDLESPLLGFVWECYLDFAR